jgi:hypothetical protein
VKIVSSRVRAVFRVHVGLVAAECLFVAASAGAATMAAALASVSPATQDERQRLVIAILVSVLAAIAWALERLGDLESVARTVDRQRGLRGAILTALQSEKADSPSSVAELLASRAAREVAPISYLRASWRASAPFLALPWFAIALWSLAAERSVATAERIASGSASAASVAGIRDRVAAIREAADRIARTPGLAPDLEAVVRRISDAAAGVERTSAELAHAQADGELRDLERRLDRVRNAIPLEAVTSGDARGRMTGPDRGIEPDPEAPMSELHPRAPASGSSTGSEEGGVLASRWWPSRYDGVVQRWLETRGQLPENRPR